MSHFFARATRVAFVVFANVCFIDATACSPIADQPEATLKRFLSHVQRGRGEEAWAALSADTRETLRARHEALARAARRPASGDVDEILFDEFRLRAPQEPESVVVVGLLGDEVRLQVTVPHGRRAVMWMVREDGEWKVDLTRSLVATSTQQAERAASEAGRAGVSEPRPDGQQADAAARRAAPPASSRPATSTPSASSP